MTDLFNNQSMVALSWKQPFGSAMLWEKIETRVWATKYRGLVLLCTSQKAYDEKTVINICGPQNFVRLCATLVNDTTTLHLNGYAIAVGKLVDCRKMKPDDELKTFVRYREDLYCHIYEEVKAIKPFRWKGAQRWKKVEQNIIEGIEYLGK